MKIGELLSMCKDIPSLHASLKLFGANPTLAHQGASILFSDSQNGLWRLGKRPRRWVFHNCYGEAEADPRCWKILLEREL
jgi:hypothetical protein